MNSDILLVTELFPPAIGGSAILYAEVYERIRATNVTVLADPVASRAASGPVSTLDREWVRIDTRKRGVRSLGEAGQIRRVGKAIRSFTKRHVSTFVHAARPLPEGVAAWALRFQSLHPPPYVCWAHGEEITAAMTSREHAWLTRQVCRNAAMMIASNGYSAELIRNLGVPSERVRIVYPGVDIEKFRPDIDSTELRTRIAPPGGPVLLSVGRLQRRKGHDMVIEAIAALSADFPGLRYVIAGDGQERRRLEELVSSRSVERHVLFLGEVPENKLAALYAACDIFLMPTRRDGPDVEGFGIVFLEAAASGKPAIGGRNGGVPEAVLDGKTGVLVDGSDIGELARAIRALASSAALRGDMGRAGRRRVVQSFTWDRAARELEALHRELTGTP